MCQLCDSKAPNMAPVTYMQGLQLKCCTIDCACFWFESATDRECAPVPRSVSKLYIPGSCANTRKNNFGFSSLNPKNIGCDTVDNYSEKTCNLVMQKGASSRLRV